MQDGGAAVAKTGDGFLKPGEEIRWTGAPKPRPIGLALEERAPAILTLGWFGIVSYAVLWSIDRGVGTLALAFVGVPAFFLARNAARLYLAHKRLNARRYIITTARALWLDGDVVVEEMPLSEVSEVSVHRDEKHRATVVLGPTNRAAEVLRRSSSRATAGRAALAPAFEGLENAEVVADVLRAALRDSQTGKQ